MRDAANLKRARACLLAIALSCCCASSAAAQSQPQNYAGRPLSEVLRAMHVSGLRIVFSSEIVTPDLRVVREPRSTRARQLLDELLEPHGLRAVAGPGGVLQIVRASRRDGGHSTRSPSQSATGILEGRIVDAATGSAIAGARVEVAGGHRAERTNERGRFALGNLPPGPQTLRLSAAGYGEASRTIDIRKRTTVTVTIALHRLAGRYSERVTVTAPPADPLHDGVGSTTIVNRKDILFAHGGLADDGLRVVEAFPRVSANDDFASGFSVRGSHYRHVAVVIDGVLTPWLTHRSYGRGDAASLAMFGADGIEQAALQTGAYPRRHGDTLGAQLQVTLREGSRTENAFRGAIGGTNATLVAEGPIGSTERGSWLLTVRHSYRDWPRRRRTEAPATVFGFTDAHAKLVYDVRPHHQISVTMIAGRAGIDEPDERAPNELADGINRTGLVNLAWRSTFGSHTVLTHHASLVGHEFANEIQTGQLAGRGSDTELSYRADLVRTMAGGVLEAGTQVQRMAASRLPGGAGGTLVDVVTTVVAAARFTASSWSRSGFAHFTWTPVAGLTIAPGIRISDSARSQRRALSRWIAGAWSRPSGWTLTASTGVSHQFPDFDQLFGRPDASVLMPERAVHADVGVQRRFGASLLWQATFFRRSEAGVLPELDTHPRLVGGTLIAPDGGSGTLTGLSRGIELLLERRTATGLSGWIAYSYGKSRYTDAARNETYWAELDQRHAVNMSAAYRISPASAVSATLRAGTNFPLPGYFERRDGALYAGAQRNEVRLPGYARLDLRARRTFNNADRRVTLFAEVLNVLNRRNFGISNGVVDRQTGAATGFTGALFPRRPSAGILIEF